jgi:phosphoribosylaminoimidazole-succinocarboxamide synthase
MPLYEFQPSQYDLIHRGKVRDSFQIDAQTRLIVVTDRISAFNKKIKTPIPHKGAVLNTLANFWFDKTQHILPNHLIRTIHPNMSLVHEAQPIRVEMVVRGYLAGSMWRAYSQGKRSFSGVELPDGMTKNQAFAEPILTPTTKDDDDLEVTEAQIYELGLVEPAIYQQMKAKALELFRMGSQFLATKGIILVDTKYEFGLLNGQLILIDEIHTPDSSRFWDAEAYAIHPQQVEQIDKEFVRLWLLDNQVDGEIPTKLPSEVVTETSRRYLDIYQRITGMPLVLGEESTSMENMQEALDKIDFLN